MCLCASDIFSVIGSYYLVIIVSDILVMLSQFVQLFSFVHVFS